MSESDPEHLLPGVVDPAQVPARRTTSYPDPEFSQARQ
jgi:hypothetical protein